MYSLLARSLMFGSNSSIGILLPGSDSTSPGLSSALTLGGVLSAV
uniref:Uncharacterized protein n=1 Tax=Triticum urartu TaxID=4572 RepID=A0A8R7U1T9_TRIUA